MKTILITIIMVLSCTILPAQNDSLRQEIMNMEASKSVLIRNGRILLLDKLLEGNLTKVKEIKDYLLSLENDDYVALYPGEKWLILFWTKEYAPILNDIRHYQSALRNTNNKILPPEDDLFEKLSAKSDKHKSELFRYIEEASVSDEEKELLDMHLTVGLKTNANTPDLTQMQLNDRADWFLNRYPESYGAQYIREYIREKWVESNWGWGVELFTGCGILSDKLKNNFSPNVALGAEFSLSYKNFNFYQRDYVGIGETKKEFSNGGDVVWWKHAEADLFLIEFALGYTAIDTRKIRIAPFAGIAGCDISPSQEDLDKIAGLGQYELDFSTTYTIGVNLDLKLGKTTMPIFTYQGKENSYWFLRFRYEYVMPQFARSYPGFEGKMHCFTIGVGGFGRKIIRAK